MKTLIIDTSTEKGVVAIAENERVLLSQELPTELNNSTSIMPAIDNLFTTLTLVPQDLSAITLGVGPGSYTGIRVAAAIGMAIAYAHQLPIIGVSSLFGYLPSEDGAYTVLIDAKIAGAYVMTASVRQGKIVDSSQPEARQIEDLEPTLLTSPHITTPNAKVLKVKIEKTFPHLNLTWNEISPNPHTFAMRGFEKFENKEYNINNKVDLLYLRKTQAEIEKEESQQNHSM